MRRSVSAAVTMTLACAFWAAGCYRSASKVEEPPPAAVAPAPAEQEPAVPSTIGTGEGERTAAPEQADTEISPNTPMWEPEDSASPDPAAVPNDAESASIPSDGVSPRAAETTASPQEGPIGEPASTLPQAVGRTEGDGQANREEPALPEDAPSFAREKEELVYRVEFLGLTMGYARFRFRGTVRIDGRVAYHLTVRAWTSDLLARIYPMNDTIEYYLDVETLAPIRLEFASSRKEDDIAYYNQRTGEIVYRYKKNGKIRKRIDAVPGVYDPVSMAYFLRTRGLVGEEPPRPMYAGRKLWEVSAKPMGDETIRTDGGEFDTVLIEPILVKEGKREHRGNLRVWMTRDRKHVPVRLYATFKKIRTWTLVGELLPDRQGG